MEGRNKNDKDLVILILLAAYTHTREYVIIYFADLTCTISYKEDSLLSFFKYILFLIYPISSV